MSYEVTRRKRDGISDKLSLSAHANKRQRQEQTLEANCSILSASVLHNKTDTQLLAFLFECHNFLCTKSPQFCVNATFVKELLNPRYLKSSLSGVQQMTGCLLCDIVRLSCAADSIGKTATTLPFDASHADDVLACLIAPFERVCRGEALLKTCEQLIERASASRIFLHLIPHCCEQMRERVSSLFVSVQCAAGDSSALESGGNVITTVTAAEMGRILVDVLNATRSITPEQLAPLLKEITTASPTLIRQIETGGNSGASNGSVLNAAQKKSRPPGAVIAARVFFEQIDVIQAAIANYVMEMVGQGAEQETAAEVTAGGDVEARRRRLRSIGRGMEIFVALMELHIDLVAQLVPALLPYVHHTDADVRLLLLRGFFMAFGSHESAVERYRSAFVELLTCFNDPKHVLRIEMVQLAAANIKVAMQISASLAEQRLQDLLPHFELRLVDSHALVRRAAVVAYGDIVAASPSFVASERMEKTLGLRVADKNFKVRQAAVEQLSCIYQKLLYPWIPNVVMRCVNAEGGVMLLELGLEAMLPPPSKVATTERLFNNNSCQSALTGRRSTGADMAIFDFEKENATEERTYVEGFAKLCSHLCPWAFNRLMALAVKKVQLRLAIFRLFQLRAEVKTKDLKSLEGQEMINDIHRLLSFLQNMTHAEKGEWDTLFRAKDDKVCKAFLSCCADGVLRYATERKLLIKTLKGRVEGPALRFVQDILSRQMMFPLETEHVDELLARLGGILRSFCRGKHTTVDTDVQCEVEGLLRALLVFGRTAPAFLPRCAKSLIEFLELFCKCDNLNMPTSWLILLLNCIKNMTEHASTSHADERGSDKSAAVSAIIEPRKSGLLALLGRLCDSGHESLFPNAPVKEVGAVCKHAARCFMALIGMSGPCDSKVLLQLVETILGNVRGVKDPVSRRVFGWLKTLTVFAKDHLAASLLQDESLVSFITTKILLNAVQNKSEALDLKKVKVKGAEYLHMSLAGAVVDAAAKCLTAIAMSYLSDRVKGAVSLALNSLFAAYKATSEGDVHTVGACRRRLSINQQLAKLVIRPSADIGKELAVAVIISAEDEAAVRWPVQRKIVNNLMHNQCDMRYASLLFLSAISEETKSGYQQLRTLVHQIGDHFRTKQTNSGATLSSPNALTCFLEYTIPFLVLFMAHHTFYSSEEKNHFVAYQRVWHLLFDELFRHGTQCAGFVVELFGHIKQATDVLDAEGHAARVICDLGSRVMQECLGQRQMGAEALKRYPGQVLLPTFFVRSKSTTDALSTIYLDASTHIFPHVPFRAPTTTTTTTTTTTAAVVTTSKTVAVGGAEKDDDKCLFLAREGSENSNNNENCTNCEDDDAVDSAEDVGVFLPHLVRKRVNRVLHSFVGSMTREEMVKVQWTEVKERLREAVAFEKSHGAADAWKVSETDVITYAKKQLQLCYENAPVS